MASSIARPSVRDASEDVYCVANLAVAALTSVLRSTSRTNTSTTCTPLPGNEGTRIDRDASL